jgi:hypothetical protein
VAFLADVGRHGGRGVLIYLLEVVAGALLEAALASLELWSIVARMPFFEELGL